MNLLRRFATAALVALLLTSLAVPNAHAVTIDMVTVGNPGNVNDTTGFGAVNYSYQIGKYDVTIGQYTEFLNAVAATDTYSLYNPNMGSDSHIKGIQQNGSSGGYSYSVIGSPNRPITYVSWFDAARFANWMTNGQGSGSTETGAYTLGGATGGYTVARNAGATFYIPMENEWYKAAYYSPVKGGPGSPGYYRHATQSDSVPGNQIGIAANQANYWVVANGGYSVTGVSYLQPNQNYLTDVGAFSGSGSFYGTFDQSGNVYQWTDDDGTPGPSRALRGGAWNNIDERAISSDSSLVPELASNEIYRYSFRLASPVNAVPEIDPAGMGSVLAIVTGAVGLLERRRKRQ